MYYCGEYYGEDVLASDIDYNKDTYTLIIAI